MKRHLSDSDGEQDYDSAECSSPDAAQEQITSRKQRRGIIEKRRRDRINNCLLELRRLVPAAFEKQGSAKLEKAEILQMTVDHLRHLHQTTDSRGFPDPMSAYSNTKAFLDYRLMGFKECVAESSRFLATMEGLECGDAMRTRLLAHLETYLAQRELAINAAVAAANTHMGAAAAPVVTPVWSFPPLSQALLTGMMKQEAVKSTTTAPTVVPSFPCLVPTIAPFMTATPPSSLATPTSVMQQQPTDNKPHFTPTTCPPAAKRPFRPWLSKDEVVTKN